MLLEERLQLCFNNVVLPINEINGAKSKLHDNPSDPSARAVLRDAMTQLRSATALKKHIPDGLREKLDSTFKDYLQRDGVVGFFGDSDNPRWRSAYESYKDAVVDIMEQHMSDLADGGNLEMASDETKEAYQTCHQKALFVLEYDNMPDLPDSVPFMSSSVWDVLSDHLKRVSKALIEVSTLYLPFAQI